MEEQPLYVRQEQKSVRPVVGKVKQLLGKSVKAVVEALEGGCVQRPENDFLVE